MGPVQGSGQAVTVVTGSGLPLAVTPGTGGALHCLHHVRLMQLSRVTGSKQIKLLTRLTGQIISVTASLRF